MKTLELSEITEGMHVVFVDGSLNANGAHVDQRRASVPLDGREGIVVRVAPDEPGKMVTVLLKEPHDQAHTCDGFTPARHGVWARPEHLYTPEMHAEHVARAAAVRERDAKVNADRARAAALAAKYLEAK